LHLERSISSQATLVDQDPRTACQIRREIHSQPTRTMGLHEMIHHYVEAGILLFLDLLAGLLTSEETSRSMPRTSGSAGASSEHDKFSDGHRTDEAAKGSDPAKEAFEAFGMSLDEARSDPIMARERLVKERRRLSRLYHPDRNLDNLEHATEQMKQLNACYEICRKELDAFEGGEQEVEISERDPSGHESSESADGGDDFTADDGDGEQFCDAMRTEREMKRQQREARRNRMRETKTEDGRAEKEYANEIRRQEEAIHVEFHRLYQQRGSLVSSPRSSRPRAINPWQAHILWGREVAKAQRQGMKSNAPPPPPKPTHHTLDGSMHYLAVAIRVGATDMALSHFWHEMILLHSRRLRPHQTQHWLSPSEMHGLSSMAANEFLDSDDNTIFHYASYYENESLFNNIMVRVGPHFVEALMRPNVRGQIPADFCVVCNDAKFKARIDAATAQARRVVRERQLSTKLRNGAKAARDILRRVDPYRVVHHGVAVGLGPVLFHHGWIISATPVLLQKSNMSYFAIHSALSLLHRLVPAWAVFFLAVPTWIYVLVALAAVIPKVRERIGRASQRHYNELAQLLRRADELSRAHSLFACMAKKGMTASQQECFDLLAYSTVWWVASRVSVRSFDQV
jgi:hypothetical protein